MCQAGVKQFFLNFLSLPFASHFFYFHIPAPLHWKLSKPVEGGGSKVARWSPSHCVGSSNHTASKEGDQSTEIVRIN